MFFLKLCHIKSWVWIQIRIRIRFVFSNRLDTDSYSVKYPDRDLDSVNTDPKH
jgi:hypothetical protein